MSSEMEEGLSQSEICDRRTFASMLVREAGEHALQVFRERAQQSTSTKKDGGIVTEVDIQLELAMRQKISTAFPEDTIFGEERGGEIGDRVWILDPIDGTTNYARRLSHWCVSIAFVLKGVPVLGAIFAAHLNEMFLGLKGEGATLNGLPLKRSESTSLISATIGFGLGAKSPPDQTLAIMRDVAVRRASVRVQGAGALTLAYIAAGRIDGFYEADIHIWDCAAAVAILRECDCKYAYGWNSDVPDEPFPIVAASPGVWEDLMACIDPTSARGSTTN